MKKNTQIPTDMQVDKNYGKVIFVDENLCTKCNTCSTVCVMGIIERATISDFPFISEANEPHCFKCGHCEVFCCQNALTLNFLTEEKIDIFSSNDGMIEPENLALYIKKRRSIRHFSSKPVPKELITKIIDVSRYAASGGNSQPVKWLFIYDSLEVQRIAGLTIDWMRSIQNTAHPFAPYVGSLISAWDNGVDLICRSAPHLVFAHIPDDQPIDDPTDAIIALTHFDISAPSFGIGTCWAGFIKLAMSSYKPLRKALSLPNDRKVVYGLMVGYPKFKINSIPRRNQVDITWL